jgi:hypothetical protein
MCCSAKAYQAVAAQTTLRLESRGARPVETPATRVSRGTPDGLLRLLQLARAKATRTLNPESSTTSTVISREQVSETPGADQTNSLSHPASF